MKINDMNPLISVVVAVYNGEKYIKRCIASILRQKMQSIEIIIIDDGSKDETPIICDELAQTDRRIIVIHQKNSGLSRSRNVGIDKAKGEYIGFVDADDWIAPEMYYELYSIMNEYKADICSSKYLVTNKNNYICKQTDCSIEVLKGRDKLYRYLEVGISDRSNLYSACTKLYKKSLFNHIRFPDKQKFEDMATNYKLINEAETFVIYNKKMYYYCMDSTGITRNRCKSGDFDLIKASRDIYQMTIGTEIEKLGMVVYARAYFSILTKYVVYGVDKNINEYEFIKEIYERYCNFYKILIKSQIPLNRKIIMPLLKISPRTLRRFFSLIKK